MKKVLLLAATALVGLGANAQLATPLSVSGTGNQPVERYQIRNTDFRPSAKSSIAGGRWYNHSSVVDFLTGGSLMNFTLYPIWFDSTVLQNFTSGLGPINFISSAQVIDPIHFTLWNDPNVFDPNIIAIKPESNYKVDSVSFSGAYVENPNRPANVVDTLIISVSPAGSGTSNYPYYFANPTASAWVYNNGYTCQTCTDSTLKGFTVLDVDSINRASAVTGGVTWKVPLTDADREPDSAGFVTILNYTFPVEVNGVPGSVDIPAGKATVMTVTFKSGDIVVPNTDTVYEYHHLLLFSGEALGAGAAMPYYHYQYRDRNSSNLMFYFDSANYFPSVFIEGWNQLSFRQEFHAMQAHIVCDDCPTVAEYAAVNNVNSAVTTDVAAYPNPAANEVTVSFSLNRDAGAKVFITNAIGQVLETQNVDHVIANQNNKVKFSTAHLAAGVYFYTVEANGQRTTNRFAVAH